MKKVLLFLMLAASICAVNAQKKTVVWEGTPFTPGAWDIDEMRFSDNGGKHFPALSDEVYWNFKTLIFDISDASDDCFGRVMNGWWSALYYDNVKFTNGSWPLQLTEEIAKDCARGNGGMGKDLALMLTSGSCTINSVYYVDDEVFCPGINSNCTEKLDQKVVDNSSKEVYAYDNNGNRTDYTYYSWNGSNWTATTRYKYTYSADGLTTATSTIWDANLNSWRNNTKKEASFDNANHQLLDAGYYWDLDKSAWVGSSKSEYCYDERGHITFEAIYNWDPYLNDWAGMSKTEYAFDEYDRQTYGASYYWDTFTNGWVGSYRFESGFTENGSQTFYANYTWDYNLNDWVGTDKTEYLYKDNSYLGYFGYSWDNNSNDWITTRKAEPIFNEDGNTIGDIIYSWDVDLKEWKVSGKVDFAYDEFGNNSLYAEYKWDSALNVWIGSCKSEDSFDERGNTIQSSSYLWNYDLNDWEINMKYEYAYDERGNQTFFALYGRGIGYFKGEYAYDERNNMILSVSYRWDYELNDWVASNKEEYAYDEHGRTLRVLYSWDYTLNKWVGTRKEEFAFDVNDNVVLKSQYIWGGNGNWQLKDKKECIYNTAVAGEKVAGVDTENPLLEETIYYIENGVVYSKKTTTYTYSAINTSAIQQINPEHSQDCIVTLYGLPVKHLLPGQIYIRNGKKFIEK